MDFDLDWGRELGILGFEDLIGLGLGFGFVIQYVFEGFLLY